MMLQHCDGATFCLRKPTRELIPAYREALMRGWSPDEHVPDSRAGILGLIDHSPEIFLLRQDDPKPMGGLTILPNGRLSPRLSRTMRWIWRDGFCGVVGLRWWAGHGNRLPLEVTGHLSYSVVPWRRREGAATTALRMLLPTARKIGLTAVDAVILMNNIASIRVMEVAGAGLVEQVTLGPHHDNLPALVYRLQLGHDARS